MKLKTGTLAARRRRPWPAAGRYGLRGSP